MEIAWEFTLVDWFIAAGIIVMIVLTLLAKHFYERNQANDLDRKFFREQWRKIEGLCELGQEMNYKLAVIEADKLLDEALKTMYFPGAGTFDRLKFATYKFPKLKHVWWAHRVRNELVHNVHYTLKYSEAKKVLELFEASLKELKAL